MKTVNKPEDSVTHIEVVIGIAYVVVKTIHLRGILTVSQLGLIRNVLRCYTVETD